MAKREFRRKERTRTDGKKKNREKQNENKRPSARLIIFAVVLVIMMGVLIKSLYDLTIVKGESYLERGDKEANEA